MDVLVESNFVGDLGLVLVARHDFEVVFALAELEVVSGVIFLLLALFGLGQILVGQLVAEDDFLAEFDGGFKLLVVAIDLDVEETALKVFLTHLTRQKSLVA